MTIEEIKALREKLGLDVDIFAGVRNKIQSIEDRIEEFLKQLD